MSRSNYNITAERAIPLCLVTAALLISGCPGQISGPAPDSAASDAKGADVAVPGIDAAAPDGPPQKDVRGPDLPDARSKDQQKPPTPDAATIKCGPCKVEISDSLYTKSATSGTVSGGQFMGSGWRSTSLNARVVYTLKKSLNCGLLEVSVTNFTPPQQYKHKTATVNCSKVECYVHFISLYEGAHGNPHKASSGGESQIELQATSEGSDKDDKIKLKTAACGWGTSGCGGGNKYTGKYNWNAAHNYQLKIRWTPTKVELSVDNKVTGSIPWSWPAKHPAPLPNLKHVFIGRDQNPGGGYLNGPVYSNLKISRCE